MNRIFTVILSIAMLFALATGTQGAVHSGNTDFSSYGFSMAEFFSMELGTDTWYDIAPSDPYFKAGYFRVEDSDSLFGVEYYRNDHTFAALVYAAPDNATSVDSETALFGSYLFDFGLFIGLEYGVLDVIASPPGPPFDTLYTFSVGYRYDLNENGYVAFSVDYVSVPDMDYGEVVGYDLDLVYFFEAGRIYFQYYLPTDEGFLDDFGLDFGVAYQAAEAIVIGFNYNAEDDEYIYDLGLTWSPDFMIFDIQYGASELDDDNYYALSGLFHLNDLYHLGLEWRQDNNAEGQAILKFKYTNDSVSFLFSYAPETDDDPAMYYLAYKMTY